MCTRACLILALAVIYTIPSSCHRHGHDISTEEPGDHQSVYDNMTLQNGKDQAGGWSQWSAWSMCSRTCDGGVSRQLRTCPSAAGCIGEPVRYNICNMQPCNGHGNISLEEDDTWRHKQCSAHDTTPYGGEMFHWTAHRDDTEPCALTCRGTPQHALVDDDPEAAEEERVVIAVLASRVSDGTRCRPGSLDMCIDGRCQRVGCDLRVGSTRRVDECGVCGGDGSTCSRPRYQWLTTPASLCSHTCGGGYKMAVAVCSDRLTGSDAPEDLCDETKKPANNVVRCNTHPCPFKWYVGDWSQCSATCGGGVRSRRVICARSANGSQDDIYDPETSTEPGCPLPAPKATQPCSQHECPSWITGPWSGCSVSCGEGMQVRGVECSPSGLVCDPGTRPDISKPCSTGISCPSYSAAAELREDDIEDMIPGVVYHTQPLIQQYPPPGPKTERLIDDQLPVEATYIKDEDWGPCSVTCGGGWRRKEVHCKIFLEFSRTIAKLPDTKCLGPKPLEDTERCGMEPCSMAYGTSLSDSSGPTYNSDSRSLTYGTSTNIRVAPGSPGKTYSWKEKGYTSCSASCLSGVQELIIQCVKDEDGKIASPYMCDPLTKPENRVRTCNDHPCPPRWNYTEFSQCTKSCGIGIQTREVTCIHEVTRGGTNTVVVPNNMCPQPPPPDRQYCNVLDCPIRWHTGEWSKCSTTCGGGKKQREVQCKQIMAQSHVVERPAAQCSSPKPATSKECNSRPCLLDTSSPEIGMANSSYIQHDPKKKKVTVKVGGSATLFSGTQVKIKCPVKGYNKTKIQWAKDHQIIGKSKKYQISRKGALRIVSLSLRDHGIYTCVAGRSSANLTLVVKARPGEFPSSEEIDRQNKAFDEPSSPLADRTDARYRAMVGGTSEDQSHEQRPGDQRKNFKNRQKGKIDKVRDALYSTAVSTTKSAPKYNSQARDIYDENETLGNSRGQRMVDHIMYHNYGAPLKTKIMTFGDKQMVFPEDDDSDIIIVNEELDNKPIRDEGNNEIEDVVREETSTQRIMHEDKEYTWKTTEWSPCNAPCGQVGHQVRGAICQRIDGATPRTVPARRCLSSRVPSPRVLVPCVGAPCAVWRVGAWGRDKCTAAGGAVSRRKVECVKDEQVVPDVQCDPSAKPEGVKRADRPCQAIWATGPWSRCIGPCNAGGHQHRVLQCVWRPHGAVHAVHTTKIPERGAGAACHLLSRPDVVRDCQRNNCMMRDGVCRDASRFCKNVRVMNMCALRRYKLRCCKSCSD